MEQRHKCKCCGYYTLVGTKAEIDWDICPVCFWENDVFEENPETYSGANHLTLAQGRENYKKFSACDLKSLPHVRLPLAQEFPENNE
ncbi:MAG: hydrolase [Clostridium sp.]|nr:hydrolase [Clostridium sp.]